MGHEILRAASVKLGGGRVSLKEEREGGRKGATRELIDEEPRSRKLISKRIGGEDASRELLTRLGFPPGNRGQKDVTPEAVNGAWGSGCNKSSKVRFTIFGR